MKRTAKPDDSGPRGEGEDGTDDQLAVTLGYHISDVARLGQTVFDTAFKPLGVTRSQSWVIGYLAAKEGIAQSDLAIRLGIGKVALGGLVDRLEAAGLVERRAAAGDRRVKRVFLTAAGRDIVARIRVTAAPIHARIFAGVDTEDLRATARTLRAVKTNLIGMPGQEEDG